MKKGYWMMSITVSDPDAYRLYVNSDMSVFARHGARNLALAGRFVVPEGTAGERNIIIEFPSYEAALACYNSAEYQAVLKLRQAAATAQVVIVEGLES